MACQGVVRLVLLTAAGSTASLTNIKPFSRMQEPSGGSRTNFEFFYRDPAVECKAVPYKSEDGGSRRPASYMPDPDVCHSLGVEVGQWTACETKKARSLLRFGDPGVPTGYVFSVLRLLLEP